MSFNVTRQPGTYYIGCPSRVTESKSFKSGQTIIPVGNFLGSEGTWFRVESGVIAIIPYEKLSVYKEDASYFGLVRCFKNPVQFVYHEGIFTVLSGKFILGINTHLINHEDDFTFKDYDDNYVLEEEDEEEEEEDEEEEDEEYDEEEDEEEEDEEEDEEEEDEEYDEEEEDEYEDEYEEEDDEEKENEQDETKQFGQE